MLNLIESSFVLKGEPVPPPAFALLCEKEKKRRTTAGSQCKGSSSVKKVVQAYFLYSYFHLMLET